MHCNFQSSPDTCHLVLSREGLEHMGMTKGYPLGSLLIFTCYFPFCLPLPLISHSLLFLSLPAWQRKKMWLLAHIGGYCTYWNFEQVPISVHSAGVHTERRSASMVLMVSWSENDWYPAEF